LVPRPKLHRTLPPAENRASAAKPIERLDAGVRERWLGSLWR